MVEWDGGWLVSQLSEEFGDLSLILVPAVWALVTLVEDEVPWQARAMITQTAES